MIKICVILLLIGLENLPEVQSATCTYELSEINVYSCHLINQNIESENDMRVDGVHLEGYSDNDVVMLYATNSSVQVFPSLIIDRFVNLVAVTLWTSNMRLFNSPITNCSRLTFVFIDNNLITSFRGGIFRNCQNLRHLLMSSNNISRIHDDAFDGLSGLQVLHLSRNRISELSSTIFQPLPQLTTLRLTNNQITEWNSTILTNNLMISLLDLNGNRISQLEERVFSYLPNLQWLGVGSDIEVLPTLQNLPRLEQLTLINNKLTRVVATMFMHMGSLKELYLTGNQITTIDFTMGTANFLVNLEVLALNRNNISHLSDNVFSMLTKLKDLNLAENSIQELNENSIRPINQMRLLTVSQNKIRRIDRALFDNVTILEFRADDNICMNQRVTINNDFEQRVASLMERCFSSAKTIQISGIVFLAPIIILALSKL